MLKRFFFPNQSDFFTLFQQLVDISILASQEFYALVKDLSHASLYVNNIADYEEKGDQIAHKTFQLLHKTFITPFERHDINHLIKGLDDILDLINRCAQRFPYYGLMLIPDEIIELAKISMESCNNVKKAIYELHSLKKSEEIFKYCERIDGNESKAHQVVIYAETKLFAQENDFKQFFKLKEIIAQTKLVINSCQDVGNLIKGIILEYS